MSRSWSAVIAVAASSLAVGGGSAVANEPAHAYDRRAPHRYAYIHYGYRCIKRDSRGSYHLTFS